ncbi:MAG: DUF3368 domain-containing protein [Candidatus Bathyarchaeia archaeon]
MPVSDATPLIYMAKLGKLHLLKEIFAQVQMPPEVKTETIDGGKAKGYTDAVTIEQALNEGWLVVDPLTEENMKRSETLAQMTGIDIGEAQVIILAAQKNEKLVLMDQAKARGVARQIGLTPRGTIYIILTAIKRRLMTKEEAKQTLDRLIDSNFYMSVKIYSETLKVIEKS